MSKRSLREYHWSADDHRAYSAWRTYVLIFYGCIAVVVSIVALANGHVHSVEKKNGPEPIATRSLPTGQVPQM